MSDNGSVKDNKAIKIITVSALLIVGVYFLIHGLVLAKNFLVPIVIAMLLSMLLMPLERKFQSWGINKGWAIILCDLLLIAAVVGLFAIISAQVKNIYEDWPQLKQQILNTIDSLRSFVQQNMGFNLPSNEELLNRARSSGSGSSQAQAAISAFMGTMADALLVFVYIFFFMYYRKYFKGFILRLVKDKDEENAKKVISESSNIAQQYLVGKMLLILFLAVLYAIGLTIVGVKYAIFVAVLAAVFSLLPYIGNLMGGILAIAMGVMGGGGASAIIGVLIVFSITQFIESYILEPYVVGHKVELNPVFTIIAVVLGGAIWGIPGMIISIPVLGILKVIFDHVPYLRAFGYLVGEDEDGDGKNIFEKAKGWFKK